MSPDVQLYARKQGATGPEYSQYVLIDLYSSDPIKLTKSIQGLEEPEKTTSGYSQTFTVPNTSSNNQYFKQVFNVNSVDYNATSKADAYINVEGAYFTSGNIRITNIYKNDKTGKIEYEIVFMGETSNFGATISPRDLSSLNLNQYTHNLTYSNVVNSWTGSLFQGDILYPLAEYGYTYNDAGEPEQSTLSVYNGTTSKFGFTNTAHPLEPEQFKPAIRVKKVWDQIFTEAGFTYTSDFIGGIGATSNSFFSDLYMLSSNTALPEFTVDGSFSAGIDCTFTILSNTTQIISKQVRINTVLSDSSNSVYVSPDNYYEAPISGQPYIFTLKDIDVSGRHRRAADSAMFVQIELLKNGTVISSQTGWSYKNYPIFTQVGGFLANTSSLTGNALVQINNNANLRTFNFVASGTTDDQFSFNFKIYGSEWETFGVFDGVFEGDSPSQVTPAGLLPAQYKQIDFIKGITQKFKLVWEPDPNNSKNFFIEPWNDWILGGTQRDWTNKLDESKDVKITPLFQTQQREIFFKDAKEGDLYNVLYEQQNKEIFGELKQDSNIELISGVKNIQTFFAPTPLAPIPGDNSFLIPHFAKDTETERQPIQVKPRLLFYNGLHNPGSSIWYINNNGTSIPRNAYPLVSNFSSYPFNNTSFDLNWTNSPQYFNFDNTGFSGRTSLTAFEQFWKRWYDFTYSPYSRLMEATFILSSTDIQALRFNDKIFVKDSWWLVQEIKDYVLGGLQACRVKLLKLADNVNYSVGISDIQGQFTRITGLCFSGGFTEPSVCTACCCQGLTNVAVYGDGNTLALSTRLYQDNGGVLFAQAGYYSDGTYAYEVGLNGVIMSVNLCSGCSCGPVGLTGATVNSGINLCDSCCDEVFPLTIYHNGATGGLSQATEAYPGPSGGLLTAGVWYRESGSNEAVQISTNGNSIQQVGECSGCICTVLPAEYTDATVVGGTGATAERIVCCNEYTGSYPTGTVYATDTVYASATGYYYDPYSILPVSPAEYSLVTGVGNTGEYVFVLNGSADLFGICDTGAAKLSQCIRDQYVRSIFIPSGGTAEVVFSYYISSETGPQELTGTATLTGSSTQSQYDQLYSTPSYITVGWEVPAIYGGSVRVRLFANNGDATPEYDTGSGQPLIGTTPTFGPFGTSPNGGGLGVTWTVILNWTP